MTEGKVEYLNPPKLHVNPAFTQVVTAQGPVKTVYIGMQNAVDGNGNIVGRGDVKVQTEQTLKDIDACLEAAGAERQHIVMWTIWIAQGQSMQTAFEAAGPWLQGLPHAPANNVVFVEFPNPDFLIGIEAIALVPETTK